MTAILAMTAMTVPTAMVSGCATYQSSFRRTRVDDRELVWAYHNGFQVTRAGKVLAEQGDWDGLAGAVACVPQAGTQAAAAASRAHAGKVYEYTGVGLAVGGLAAGAAIAFSGRHDGERAFLGLLVAGSGDLIGLSIGLAGQLVRARADTTAIDAVNLFNDERATCHGPE